MEQRLYRTRNDRVLAGVCGGLGRYLKIDPVVLRVVAVVLLLMSFGTMLLAYLVLALIIPLEPVQTPATRSDSDIVQQ
jgi:phage shock protein PspC (stress-responsive transcriptional regulator)